MTIGNRQLDRGILRGAHGCAQEALGSGVVSADRTA